MGVGDSLLTGRGDLWWMLWCAAHLPLQEWRLLALLLAVSSWLKPPSGPLALQSCLPQGHLYILSAQGWKSHPSFRTFHGVDSSHHFKCITIQLPLLPTFSFPSPSILFPSTYVDSRSSSYLSPTCQSLSQPLVLREPACDTLLGFTWASRDKWIWALRYTPLNTHTSLPADTVHQLVGVTSVLPTDDK